MDETNDTSAVVARAAPLLDRDPETLAVVVWRRTGQPVLVVRSGARGAVPELVEMLDWTEDTGRRHLSVRLACGPEPGGA